METLKDCLGAWMKSEETSATALAEKLGYRSKTTVLRLLHAESNAESQRQLYEKLRPGLSPEWQTRFEQALRVEKAGPRRYALLESLERQLFSSSAAAPSRTEGRLLPPYVTRGRMTILGQCGERVRAWMEGWLALRGIEIRQYFIESELLNSSWALPFLIGHMAAPGYQAALLRDTGSPLPAIPWNTVYFTADEKAYALYDDGEKAAWLGLPGGKDSLGRLLAALDGIEQTPLYRFDQLKNGSDYMDFTQNAYRMEKNRAALILKPTPGVQMMPAEVVEQSFQDFLSLNLEPISAARETLISTYEKRVGNFFGRKKPTRMILSAASMLEFARTGVVTDQFFACRPYTADERRRVLLSLRGFGEQPQVSLSFRDGPAWPVSAEAYDGVGALFYPSATNYQTESDRYRELFLPGQKYFEILEQLFSFLPPASDAQDTEEIFDRLLAACK